MLGTFIVTVKTDDGVLLTGEVITPDSWYTFSIPSRSLSLLSTLSKDFLKLDKQSGSGTQSFVSDSQ